MAVEMKDHKSSQAWLSKREMSRSAEMSGS